MAGAFGDQLSAATLLAWSNQRLGKTQRLAALEIVDALPRSPIGKVLKRELRELFQAGAASSHFLDQSQENPA